jgi:hypothetical protein
MEDLERIYVNFYTKMIIIYCILLRYSSDLFEFFAIKILALDKVFINLNPQ